MTHPSEIPSAAMHGDPHGRDAWRIELSRELAFQASLEGTITDTNGVFADVLGWSCAELRTKNFMDLVHPDDVSKTKQEWRRAVDSAAPSRFRVRHRRKDGTSRWVSWSTVVRENSLCAVGKDETVEVETVHALHDREAALSRYQRADSIVRLAAGLRHEFNNLFQTILSALQLVQRLIRADRIPETGPFIESAMRAGRDAATINQRVAALSRSLEPSPTVLAMNDLVADIVDLLRRAFPHSFEFVTVLAADLWTVRCDPAQAQLVVLNLILNACDAISDAGSVAVTTSNCDQAPINAGGASGGFIAIEVTGSRKLPQEHTCTSGNDIAALKSIPDLNLLMVRRFALDNGGRLSVDVQDRGAATMVLYLPRAEPVSPAAA